MRWRGNFVFGPTFARAVHRKIKTAPKTYARQPSIGIWAPATTAERPVSNAVMQAKEGHPRIHAFVYGQ